MKTYAERMKAHNEKQAANKAAATLIRKYCPGWSFAVLVLSFTTPSRTRKWLEGY